MMAEKKYSEQEYASAAEALREAALRGSCRAAGIINAEQLELYFRVGCFVSFNCRSGSWGKDSIGYISSRLRKEIPGLRGFSERNMKCMRSFYESWRAPAAADGQPDVSEDDMLDHHLQLTGFTSRERQDFLLVPFTQHCTILSKVRELYGRLFYIHLCAEEHLSVKSLVRAIESDEFRHPRRVASSASRTLCNAEQYKKAVLSFRDEHQLEFINAEELGARDAVDEYGNQGWDPLLLRIRNVFMTSAKGFAFIGDNFSVSAHGCDHFIDLLFFSRCLTSLVAVMLSNSPDCSSGICGCLRTLDDQVRQPNENPSIGIILCRDADKNYVEYIAQDYEKPMGVAVYKTSNELPEHLREVLPDMDELKKLL